MSPSRRTAYALSLLVLVGCPKEIPVPFDPPEARADYAQTALNTPVTLTPLLNDFDPTNETMTVVSITAASHGTAVLNLDGTVDYTPGVGYLGPDSFTVTIRDTSGWESTSSAYLTVGPSQRIAFLSNHTDVFTFQLYMLDLAHPLGLVPINSRLRITKGPDISHTQVQGYAAPTPDGVNLMFLADDDETRGVSNLFHADLRTPGISTKLTDIQSGQAIGGFSPPQLAADGLHVYYLSNEFQPEVFEIVQVEVANPANRARINTPLAFGTVDTDNDLIERFALTPDGVYMLYVVRDADGAGPATPKSELRIVELANPGVSTVISGAATAGRIGVTGSSGDLGFRFVPGTTQVVYAASENGLLTVDLYIVDYLAPTTPVKLSGVAFVPAVRNFGFTPDGARVIYVSSEDAADVLDLYSVSLATPGVSTRLSKLRTGPALIGAFSIGRDSSFALYTRDDDTANIAELYLVDFANPTVQVKVNHALRPIGANPVLEPAEFVIGMRVSPGEPRKIIYTTNTVLQNGLPYQKMYLVDVDAIGTETVIGKEIFVGHMFIWGDDGDTIIFQDSAPENFTATTLNMVRTSAPSVLTRLTPENNGGDIAKDFSFLP